MTDLPNTPGAADPDQITGPELDRMALSVAERFAPHVAAADVEVREAEHRLAEAREALVRAEEEVENAHYVSDPLVFMRVTVAEELEGLARKSKPKKVRANFRYLVARAVELAEGELAGYRKDMAAARRDRVHGVETCRQDEQVAVGELAEARAMQQRVRDAERAALDGIQVLREKISADPA